MSIYSSNMSVSSQLQLIKDFAEPEIGTKLSFISTKLKDLVPEVTDEPLSNQVESLMGEIDIPAFVGVLERNEAFGLSSNQLFHLVNEICANAESKMETNNHNPHQFGRIVQSQFNAGASNYINPELRNLREDRRQSAEDLLRTAMGMNTE